MFMYSKFDLSVYKMSCVLCWLSLTVKLLSFTKDSHNIETQKCLLRTFGYWNCEKVKNFAVLGKRNFLMKKTCSKRET